ncbi:small ribosomal subunit protein mS35 [Pyxicephalus adspersus]|uniref:Small ribosomal subunit protein mS35 mitochondrial conserved domain-containing protein n=1 Tax=Pyxicephalus adspersus TaxID=30357 RepID=A0AAV3AR36_PYXAD|nr:TPA: hypothetical protein GDO54_006337 [Pyxicephalus adspersus]
MAASMLSRVCVTLRTPGLCGVTPGRVQHYSNGVAVSGKVRKRPRSQPRWDKSQTLAPRTERMLPDQDWTSVYPSAASFKPSTVPLPVRMGFPMKRSAPPDKYGNLELVKIPNFLHLTPIAIKKHCAALKDFCSAWPAALSDDDKCNQHFPLELTSVDYVFAGPSIRNPKARIVTLQIKLSSLNLDKHARNKLIKLAGSRYNKESDILSIQTDRCPLRMQNEDYAMYLLTVLYHESCKTEAWENDLEECDIDEYIWEGSRSEKNALQTLSRLRGASSSSEEILKSPAVHEYRSAMLNLRNQGETEDSISAYKQSVKSMLGIA